MTPQEEKFKQYHTDLVSAFQHAFPGIDPPTTSWIQMWLTRYSFMGVLSAIQTLQQHSPEVKAHFTQDSVGRAVSTLLRKNAMQRAIGGTQTPGVSR